MQKKLTLKIVYFILTVVIFFVISETVYSQATNCDFWGTATYNGNNVEDGDVIKAYDPQGVHCGTAYYVSDGNYGIHVSGDDPSTSDTDEGATEGDAITFKINGKTASIVSGSNTWTNNGSVECNLSYTAPSHNITIQTNPSGLNFTVDGIAYSGSQVFSWTQGSSHDISVTSPQSGGTGTRYIYSSWSDGGAQSHSYTVGSSDETVTANFTTQYYLTVTSSYGSPTGSGWYNQEVSADFSVTSPDIQGDTRYVFLNWSGDCSSSNPFESLLMDEPKTVTANWKTQYYLTVNSSHGNPQGAGWYDPGDNAEFSVTSPDVQGNTRYIFNNWSDDFSGTSTSGSVTMNAGKTVTANWTTQYYLSTAENPDAGGDITPIPPGTWYNAGANASLTVTVSEGYGWLGWSGDLSGTDMSPNITMNRPKSVTANFGKEVNITFTTNPTGLKYSVDGAVYNSEKTFTWIETNTYTITAQSLQNAGSGARYVYNYWSDGGNRSHTYTVPGSDKTVTAHYRKQYTLTVNSVHGNPQGAGWYNENTSADFSVTTPDAQGDTRYVFLYWSGDYSDTNPSGSITMNTPKSVTAHWKTQYLLTVNSSHGNPQGAGWYDNGDTAEFSVTSPDEQGTTRYVFDSWAGDCSGTNPEGSVTMDAGKNVTALWITQFYLTIAANPDVGGNIIVDPAGYWYDKGLTVSITAQPDTGNGYQFTEWSCDLSGSENPVDIAMDTAKNVIANFELRDTKVSDNDIHIVTNFTLLQNHPNPFNPETEITYSLPKSAHVTLTVYNMIGQPVRTLIDTNMPAGTHQVIWDAKNNADQSVPSGIYVYILKSGSYTEMKKALLMK